MNKRQEYFSIGRDDYGTCNVCLLEDQLTWDHVPPKGAIELSAVEQQSLMQRMVSDPTLAKPEISQNGLKFNTLCGRCNSLAGREYDPTFNDFCTRLRGHVESGLILPNPLQIPTKPVRLIKSLIIHLLAAKGRIENTTFDESLRVSVATPDAPIAGGLHVFFWYYGFKHFSVRRDLLMPAVRGRFDAFAMFSMLKFFPIAFLATDTSSYEGLQEFIPYCQGGLDDVVDIPMILGKPRDGDWPERVDDGNVILGGQSLASAIDARPRGRKQGT